MTSAIRVHEFATVTTPTNDIVNDDATFAVENSGYESVAHLQLQGRSRWHRGGDKVTNTETGIVITYARPRVTVVAGWKRTETGRTVSVVQR